MTGTDRNVRVVANELPDAAIICGCENFSFGEMRRILAANPGLDYETFQKETGAGARCTACLLDLEYYFAQMPRSGSSAKHSVAINTSSRSRLIKDWIYRRLDSVPPKLSLDQTTWMPVLCGPRTEQFLCISNRSLLFDDMSGVVPLRVRVRVRDADGRIVRENKQTVGANDRLRIELADALRNSDSPELSDPPAWRVGSLEIHQAFLTPGVRGTTRAQVEWVLGGGANSLHTQGAPGGYDRIISVPYMPESERILFTLVNCGDRPARYTFEYPKGRYSTSHDISLPGRATRIHQVQLTDEQAAAFDNSLVLVQIRGVGRCKMHLICATRAFDRMSVDHV